MNRKAELSERLEQINYQITKACKKANREVDEITLVAVTKNFPASDVEILAQLGVKNVGENKDQEAKEKFKEVQAELNWHFVGQLQTNKVKSVLQYASYIHSVDRPRLAAEINKVAQSLGQVAKVFLQVDLGGDDPNRAGVAPAELAQFSEQISQLPNIEVVGLMAVAPLAVEPRAAFDHLSTIRAEFLKTNPTANLLSSGMSEDFEVAIEFGATHLRIGSLLLGVRPTLL
jgi:pyridoxal phosphate enzyme (YggS family)